jgi:hypothetical protein
VCFGFKSKGVITDMYRAGNSKGNRAGDREVDREVSWEVDIPVQDAAVREVSTEVEERWTC